MRSRLPIALAISRDRRARRRAGGLWRRRRWQRRKPAGGDRKRDPGRDRKRRPRPFAEGQVDRQGRQRPRRQGLRPVRKPGRQRPAAARHRSDGEGQLQGRRRRLRRRPGAAPEQRLRQATKGSSTKSTRRPSASSNRSSTAARRAREANRRGSPAAGRRSAASTSPSFGEHLKNEGTADVGGTDTTKLSGDLDPSGASDLLVRTERRPRLQDPARAAGKLPSVGDLKKSGDELSESLKKAHVEFYVGEDDHIVRRIVADLVVEPKDSERNGPKSISTSPSAASTRNRKSSPRAGRSRSASSSSSSASTRSNCSARCSGAKASSRCSNSSARRRLPNLFGGGEGGEAEERSRWRRTGAVLRGMREGSALGGGPPEVRRSALGRSRS